MRIIKRSEYMNWYRSEEEVDKLIETMLGKGKGVHITQSVVFNKQNPRQMRLLKMILMSTESFSGFMKELTTHKFKDVKLPSEIANDVQSNSNRIKDNSKEVLNSFEHHRVEIEEDIKEVQNNFESKDESIKDDKNSFEQIKTPVKKNVGNFI